MLNGKPLIDFVSITALTVVKLRLITAILSNKLALERLAHHYRCSESDMLNKLISQADIAVTSQFAYGDDQWNILATCDKKAFYYLLLHVM